MFARTSPEHKLRLVEALQADGAVVSMTGDGVNDAPALKRADVGVAMGRKGTEAAKEAAEMVLADDNFATIAAAVREGRIVYDNLVKVVGWALPTNGGQAMAIVAAVLLGLTMPMTPAQILWVNMVTASRSGWRSPSIRAEPGVMRRPPRPPRAAALGLPGVADGPGLGPPPGRHLRPVRVGDAARAGSRRRARSRWTRWWRCRSPTCSACATCG